MAYERALEYCENEKETEEMKMKQMKIEKERESQRANDAERERDALKELLQRADKTNEYMMEKNCLQSSHINHKPPFWSHYFS